jgi:hypothetical protein
VCPLASPGLQVYPEPEAIEDIEKKHRHRRLDGYPQTWETVSPPDTGTKSSLRKFSQFDMSTSNSDSSRGSLFAGVGKEGEDLGKLRKESSRNAPDNDDHF